MKKLKLCSTLKYYMPAFLIFYIKMYNVIKSESLEIVIKFLGADLLQVLIQDKYRITIVD